RTALGALLVYGEIHGRELARVDLLDETAPGHRRLAQALRQAALGPGGARALRLRRDDVREAPRLQLRFRKIAGRARLERVDGEELVALRGEQEHGRAAVEPAQRLEMRESDLARLRMAEQYRVETVNRGRACIRVARSLLDDERVGQNAREQAFQLCDERLVGVDGEQAQDAGLPSASARERQGLESARARDR